MVDKNGEQEFVVKKATLTSIYDEIREIREIDIPELKKNHETFCEEFNKVKDIPDRMTAIEENCKVQMNKFEQAKIISETEVGVLNRIKKERKDAKEEEHNKTVRILKIIAVIISIVTIAGYYLW